MDLQIIYFDRKYDYSVFALANPAPLLMPLADKINDRLLADADEVAAKAHPAVVFVTDDKGIDGAIRYFREDSDDMVGSLRTLTQKGLTNANLVCVDGAWDGVGYESLYDTLVELEAHSKLQFSRVPDTVAAFSTKSGKSVQFCWTYPQ